MMILKAVFAGLILISGTPAFAHGMSADDQAFMLNASYFDYVWLGASHMLSGYDHLLFLLGVMFFLTSFKDILKFITAFTVGHSISLIFATLLDIKANYYLIDAVIAITVCYKAFENLNGFKKLFGLSAPNLAWMVFIFGLIHGFGLSTRLQQLPLGEQGLVVKILSFNLGVEIGQILALSIMLIVLMGWRKTNSFMRLSQVTNALLMAAGIVLFFMQLHGYQHTQYPSDFPLNKDDHNHLHHDNQRTENTKLPTLLTAPIKKEENHLDQNIFTEQGILKTVMPEKAKEPGQHSHDGEHFHSH